MLIHFYVDTIYFYIWFFCGLATLIFEIFYEIKTLSDGEKIKYYQIPRMIIIISLYLIIWPYIVHEQVRRFIKGER